MVKPGAGRGSPRDCAPPRDGSWLHHERLGFNYRMSEINAAMGVAQMQRLDELIQLRNDTANRYVERLLDVPELTLPTIDSECSVMSWFVFVVRLAAGYTREERDRVIAGLRMHEIGAGDYFPCIHLQPIYQRAMGFGEGSYPIAESVSQRTIALPFFSGMSHRDIDIVAQTLELMISRENLSRRD
ncbi:MAG: DegT/DnrJ/EryC1/StrS family aminotransferase [Phycisphaerales bacterium]